MFFLEDEGETAVTKHTEPIVSASKPSFVNSLEAPSTNSTMHVAQTKIYYISLQVDNQESNETIVLHWSLPDDFKDRESEKDIPGMTVVKHEFILGAAGVPNSINFEAHRKSTGHMVKLNGKESLKVIPSEVKNTIKVHITLPKGTL